MRAANKIVPVQSGERIQVVDVLRGFAIFGILLMNMRAFSGQGFSPTGWSESLDRNILILIDLLAQAKFYSLFSFLFGWGMAMQMERAEKKNVKFIPFYMRRLIVLFIFGGLHSIFLWNGDILTMYSLLGIALLLLFSRRSGKVLLIAFIVSLLTAAVMALPGESMDNARVWCRSLVECLQPDNLLPGSLYVTGNYIEVTRLRFQEYLGGFWWVPCYFGSVFAMMLLGLYVGKRRIFENVQDKIPLIKKTMWLGLSIGLPLNGLFVYGSLHPFETEYASFIRIGARTFGAPALTLFYISAILLYFQTADGRQRLAPLSFVGRMALSNYIMHSIVFPLIFNGYGLGLYGETDPTFGLILTVIMYLAQIRMSQWWFERFQYGPLEWLWRTLSYATQQPFSAMSSYESIRDLSFEARRRRTLVLTSFSILLIVGVGYFANQLIQKPEDSTGSEVPQTGASETEVAQVEGVDPGEEPVPFVYPDLRPVNRIPGPIAASGDLHALSATFNAEMALAHIEYLTTAYLNGRYAGSTSGYAAGDYIARQFDRYGLQPVGDEGSYYQSFPLQVFQLTSMPYLGITDGNGNLQDDFKPYRDFKPFIGAYAGTGSGEGDVIWLVDCTPRDLRELNVVGKVIFCRDGDILSSTRLAVENGAAGLLVLADPAEQKPGYRDVPLPAWIPEPIPVYYVYSDVARKLLDGSGYTVPDLTTIYEPVRLNTRVNMSVGVENPCGDEACFGRNVLGVIPGSDPAYADRVMIVSANYDGLGKFPDGSTMRGANDNASGIGVLLEIARSWQEQGYVPRVTTLFVAWDAGEQDLLGAEYYINNPKYPLDKTIAIIDLDKVGAGGETLQIDGNVLVGQIQGTAERLGIESEPTVVPSREILPFLEKGWPAHVLSWIGSEDFSHSPADTSDTIQLDRLQKAGQLTDLVLLSLADGRAGINDLLARRAEAVTNGDLNLFLDTSAPQQRENDTRWFEDARLLNPVSCELTAAFLQVEGNFAHALIGINLEVPLESADETRTIHAEMPVVFEYTDRGWLWAGPDLQTTETAVVGNTRFTIHYPGSIVGTLNDPALSTNMEDTAAALNELAGRAAEEYIRIASRLSLPTDVDVHMYIYTRSEHLEADTSLLDSRIRSGSFAPNVIKVTYSPVIFDDDYLDEQLAHLILANGGIPEDAFPWLWQGLPLVLEGDSDPVDMQLQMLTSLRPMLSEESNDVITSETSWAAVEYLRVKLGWDGLGRMVNNIGRACLANDCATGADADQALTFAIRLDSQMFDTAWQTYWRSKLDKAQSDLDELLIKRRDAVSNGDETAFLQTIDRRIPNLFNEERNWFDDLSQYPVETFELSGEPLAFLDDGSILASVKMEYVLENVTASWGRGNLPLMIRFAPSGNGYLWSGPMMETLSGTRLRVRYPQGKEELAGTLLAEAEMSYTQFARELGVANPQVLTINLYDDRFNYRSSVALSFAAPEWEPGWSAPGQSIKILLIPGRDVEEYRPILVEHLSRQLLRQMGVDNEWLLTGAAVYFSRNVDDTQQRKAEEYLSSLQHALEDEIEFDLTAYPPVYRLSEDQYKVALSQAWETTRYFTDTYGQDALLELIKVQRTSSDMDTSLRSVAGLSMLELDSAWKDSFAAGHLPVSSLDIANRFDPENAQAHIDFLTQLELAGRQAGSSGSEQAAAYIAEQFASYGLTVEQQTFPVEFQQYLETPSMRMTIGNANNRETFIYRDDFLILQNVDTNGTLTDEMVWVADDNYTNLDLDGKVVIRVPSLSVEKEIAIAGEHGASALILVGDRNRPKDVQAKYPIIPPDLENPIPVYEFTRKGINRLLELTGQSQAGLAHGLPVTYLNVRVSLRISIEDLEMRDTANIIGVLPGTDPNLMNEYIIIGAHYDHVGDEPKMSYSGANDDASGVAVLLEIARLWQEAGYRPGRSVLFVAWGAQEYGEAGSRYFIENPTVPLNDVMAMIQMDAVGGGDGYYLGAQGSRGEDGLLLFSIQKASQLTGVRLQVSLPETTQTSEAEDLFSPAMLFDRSGMLDRSDDIPFREAGVPSMLLRWIKANEQNLPDDIADEVLPERLDATGKMITATLMMLAK